MTAEGLTNRCREEFAQYVRRLETKDLLWYESASNHQYWFWHACVLTSLFAGFASGIVAALMTEKAFGENGRLFLTLIPIVGSIATALLTQFRFRELEDLRERGRIEMEDIIGYARGQLFLTLDETGYHNAYEETRSRVKALDLSQHRTFTDLLRQAPKQSTGAAKSLQGSSDEVA